MNGAVIRSVWGKRSGSSLAEDLPEIMIYSKSAVKVCRRDRYRLAEFRNCC